MRTRSEAEEVYRRGAEAQRALHRIAEQNSGLSRHSALTEPQAQRLRYRTTSAASVRPRMAKHRVLSQALQRYRTGNAATAHSSNNQTPGLESSPPALQNHERSDRTLLE